MIGVDVSVWNDEVDFQALKAAGIQFVICRTSYGLAYTDETFMKNANEAFQAGLKVGAYHYSTAMNTEQARKEAEFCKAIIEGSGVLLELPVFFDMEDADKTKEQRGFDFSRENVTSICRAWLEEIQPLNSGIYASFSWLDSLIDWRSLGCAVWNAQWSKTDDLQGYMWQFSDSFKVAGKVFDGNIIYDEEHKAGLNPWEVLK